MCTCRVQPPDVCRARLGGRLRERDLLEERPLGVLVGPTEGPSSPGHTRHTHARTRKQRGRCRHRLPPSIGIAYLHPLASSTSIHWRRLPLSIGIAYLRPLASPTPIHWHRLPPSIGIAYLRPLASPTSVHWHRLPRSIGIAYPRPLASPTHIHWHRLPPSIGIAATTPAYAELSTVTGRKLGPKLAHVDFVAVLVCETLTLLQGGICSQGLSLG